MYFYITHCTCTKATLTYNIIRLIGFPRTIRNIQYKSLSSALCILMHIFISISSHFYTLSSLSRICQYVKFRQFHNFHRILYPIIKVKTYWRRVLWFHLHVLLVFYLKWNLQRTLCNSMKNVIYFCFIVQPYKLTC